MIVTFATFWSRAKRRNKRVLYCPVSTAAIAQAAVRSAELCKQPVILAITSQDRLEREVMAISAYKYAAASSELVLVEVGGIGSREEITPSLLGATQAVAIPESDTDSELSSWLRTRAHPTLGLTGLFSWRGSYMELVDQSRRLSIDMAVVENSASDPRLSVKFLADARKQAGLPIFVSIHSGSPAYLRMLLKSGIEGISLGHILDESFTAGLRTSLRNRSLSDPNIYFKPAEKAVAESIRHYSGLLNP